MNNAKNSALNRAYKQFIDVGFRSEGLSSLQKFVVKDVAGYGSTEDEKIQGIAGLKVMLRNQKKQTEGMKVTRKTKPLSRYITEDENTAVYADDVYLSIKAGKELIKMYLRFSVVLNYINDQWKVIHWHVSKPEHVLSEEDTFGIDSLKQKNAELEKLVQEKTADLTRKNRELEIEASLERVRSRSMAMHKSDELKQVIRVVLDQFVHLKINVGHAGFYIDYKAHDDMHIWLADPNLEPFFAVIPYFDTTTWNSFLEAKAKGITLHTDLLDFKTKNKFYKSLFKLFEIPEEAKEFYLQCKGLAVSTVLLDSVGLYIENFDGIPYTDEENNILLRFGKVFQQTYTRFLDLQKAEAQTLRAEQDLIEIKAARKKAEETLIELQATQKQLIQSEKMASLGELTAGIAHEIQNPLNFVNNFSEVSNELIDEMNEELDKGDMEEVKVIAADIKQNLEKINHHGQRAADIVKGMLQHSRSSSGQKELTVINALCDEYLRLAYHGLRAKDKSFNAKFETDFDTTLPKINIIPQDMGRVILNVINNAFYAVNEKAKQGIADYEPTVLVSTKKENGNVLISVKDNGNGIPEKIKEKIFQPFFTTKPTGKGTGLGLSLSYDIVKAHGGSMKVNSTENEGALFTIELPAS